MVTVIDCGVIIVPFKDFVRAESKQMLGNDTLVDDCMSKFSVWQAELNHCLNETVAQHFMEASWGSFTEYWIHHKPDALYQNDHWDNFPHKTWKEGTMNFANGTSDAANVSRNNIFPTMALANEIIIIYEPCNTAANLPYYRAVVETCKISFNGHFYNQATRVSFTILGYGSSSYHASENSTWGFV